MKHIIILVLLALGAVNAKPQESRKLISKDLIGIAEGYGIDSALKLIKTIEIYRLDTPTTINLIGKCDAINEDPYQYEFFNAVAQNIACCRLGERTQQLIKELRKPSMIRGEWWYSPIPDEYLSIIHLQNDRSLNPHLKEEYDYWEALADSLYKQGTKKMTKAKRRNTTRIYFTSKENSYKIGSLLNAISNSLFSVDVLQAQKKYLENNHQTVATFKKAALFREALSDTLINLTTDFQNLDAIPLNVLDNHIAYLMRTSSAYCKGLFLIKENAGIYQVMCEQKNSGRYGASFQIFLKDSKSLSIKKISAGFQ